MRKRVNLSAGATSGLHDVATTSIAFVPGSAPGFSLGAGEYAVLAWGPPEAFDFPSRYDEVELIRLVGPYTAGAAGGAILRGQEGTAALAHTAGHQWRLVPVASDFAVENLDASGLGAISGDLLVVAADGSVEAVGSGTYATAADLTTEETARVDADVVLADEIADVETYAGRVVDMVTAAGQLSRMVWVPAFQVEDIDAELGTGLHPAFRVGGLDLPGFWCGMYQGIISGGELISLPNVDPTVSTNYDDFSTAARACGAGWHMLTNAEWAAITLWALKQGYVERGNTNWGRSHIDTSEEGYRGDVEYAPGVGSGHGRTLTGSGPDTWRVPPRPWGIADLVGNVWEWVAGFRTQDGDIQLVPDNDAATADLSAGSLDWVSQGWTYTTPADGASAMFSTVGIQDTGGATPLAGTDLELAKQLGLAPLNAVSTSLGRVYRNSFTGERVPLRGGRWSSGGSAGWFACNLSNVRADAFYGIGARPALVVL